MSTVLFISPHLDDVVFSCAALLQELAHTGSTVVVASVFTAGENHEERCLEDLAAAELLGFQARHLHLEDAPFRTPCYSTFSEILHGWHEADLLTVRAVQAHLQALEEEFRPSWVYAPLGAGTHVDHRIVHQAVRHTCRADQVRFYEDLPYAYARGAVELRLTTLGVAGLGVDPALLLEDYHQLPFVRRFLPKGAEAAKCEKLLLAPLAAPAAPAVHTAASTLLEGAVETCHRAAQCYASQYAAFCGGAREHVLWDRRHSQHLGSSAAR